MLEQIVTHNGSADWVLNVVFYSLVVLLFGWIGLKLCKKTSAPLFSGICLTLMLCVLILPLCFLFFPSQPRALFPVRTPAVDADYSDKLNDSLYDSRASAASTTLDLPPPAMQTSTLIREQKKKERFWFSHRVRIGAANGFGIIWMLGFTLMLGRLGWGLRRLSRFKKRLQRIPEEKYALVFSAVQNMFPGSMIPRLYVSDEIDSPITLGVFHPLIVFPYNLFSQINDAELRSILLHEMAHVFHKDHGIGIVQRIVQALYWWNPLIYPISRGFSRAREYISDNYAIQGSSAFIFAHNLKTLAEKANLPRRIPASTGILAPQLSLEKRIGMIMSEKRTMQTHLRRPATGLLLLLLLLLMVSALRYSWTLGTERQKFITANLPQLATPTSINVDGDEIFITDETSVWIYNLQDFTLKNRFGRKGPGPGEFEIRPQLSIFPEYLLVNSMGKLGYYSRDGVLQNELELPFPYFYMYYPMLPVGDKYLGFKLKRAGVDGKIIHVGSLYNQDFRLLREFYWGGAPQLLPPPPPGRDRPKIDVEVVYDCFDVAVAEDKIFVADTRKGFYIAVFDFEGKQLYEIKKDYTKLRIPEEFKKSFLQEQRESGRWDWLQARYNYVFRKYYPAFFSFKLIEGKIYVATFASQDDNYELILMDLTGNIKRRAFVFPLHPLKRISSGNLYAYSNEYDIHDNKIYYLKRNMFDKTIALNIKSININD